ncbi:hypothetical protein J2Z31_005346 [Sinorhizobium kostiense]|uniref:Uncharacterized protein n=1 Tax=Sinorhizobium kostiense TaxID=76747 RepID=A0ABS4R7C5_9HYPH|nr:hypothetical protein [Sinorhizobium kostiense]
MPIFFFYVMVHAPLVIWTVAMEEHVAFYRGSGSAYQSAASVDQLKGQLQEV